MARQTQALGIPDAVYYGIFDPSIPGWDDPGTFHSSDLWFWFETLAKCWRPFKGFHDALARQMCNYMSNFIRSGDPNGPDHDGVPMPRWERALGDSPAAMGFRDGGCVPQLTQPAAVQRLVVDAGIDALK